jgi:hypothetical protein
VVQGVVREVERGRHLGLDVGGGVGGGGKLRREGALRRGEGRGLVGARERLIHLAKVEVVVVGMERVRVGARVVVEVGVTLRRSRILWIQRHPPLSVANVHVSRAVVHSMGGGEGVWPRGAGRQPVVGGQGLGGPAARRGRRWMWMSAARRPTCLMG